MDMLVLKQTSEEDLLINLADKLDEETCEVMHASRFRSKEEIAEEALDVIQVCIGIMDKLSQDGIDIEAAVKKHNMKLLTSNPSKPERPWEYTKVIHIEIE